MTWVLILFNLAILVWMISGAVSAAHDRSCAGLTGDDLQACQAGTAVGSGIGFTMIVVVWFIGMVVLGMIWLMTARNLRQCPECGSRARRGEITCRACGHDFRVPAQQH
jgi:uncharacterized membrane protein YhaH (DUF805 family)